MQWLSVALLAGCLCLPGLACAAAGVVTSVKGTLTVQKADGAVRILSQHSEIDVGDLLNTEKDSYARIRFSDGSEVAMRPGSSVKVDNYGYIEEAPEEDSLIISLVKGGLRTITGLIGKRGNRDAYRLQTATATIGIRGTHYGVLHCLQNCGKLADGVYVDVASGRIAAANNAGEVEFGAGQLGYIESLDTLPVVLEEDPGIPPFPDAFSFEDGQTGGSGCFIR